VSSMVIASSSRFAFYPFDRRLRRNSSALAR
jgi:hypothetical protein